MSPKTFTFREEAAEPSSGVIANTERPADVSQDRTPEIASGEAHVGGLSSSSHFRLYAADECTGRDNYPEAWHQTIKHEVRELAGHRCVRCKHPYRKGDGQWSACDKRCGHKGPVRLSYTAEDGSRVENYECELATEAGVVVGYGKKVEARYRILTVHHLDGNKGNCRWWNLVALCQRCHLQIQGKVVMDRRWPHDHSFWFRPYVAGYYAHVYLREDLTREQVEARLDELLELEDRQMELA